MRNPLGIRVPATDSLQLGGDRRTTAPLPSQRRLRRSTIAALALGLATIGSAVVSPRTTSAAVYHTTGTAYTVVNTTAGLHIWTNISTYGYAPQDVAVQLNMYDYSTGRWMASGWTYCWLNRGPYASFPASPGAACNVTWQLYPRAGKYYVKMDYAWLTTSGWQGLPENIGQFLVR